MEYNKNEKITDHAIAIIDSITKIILVPLFFVKISNLSSKYVFNKGNKRSKTANTIPNGKK